MTELQFTDSLPPGVQIVGEGPLRKRGVTKAFAERDLRANAGKWALVYKSTSWHTISEWRVKSDGGKTFEIAHDALPDQDGVEAAKKKYKVWIRFVGDPESEPKFSTVGRPVNSEQQSAQVTQAAQSVSETGLVPTETPGVVTDAPAQKEVIVADQAEPSPAPPAPAAPAAPAPPPPAVPAQPVPDDTDPVLAPPPTTAFQKAWADGGPPQEIVD